MFFTDVKVSALKNLLEVSWDDGHSGRFHACWLRYNCRCMVCRKTVVGQRNVNRILFPDQLTVETAEINPSKDTISIFVGGDTCQDHVTSMDADWLRSKCYCDQCLNIMLEDMKMKFSNSHAVPRIDYSQISSDENQFSLLEKIFDVGFAVLTNVPCFEGKVLEVATSLGIVIDTTYGKVSNVYDSPAKSENIANSTIGLPLHTDQCHYEAGPGVQLLHAIQFDECVEGGDSQLVDMFKAIDILRSESPKDFRVLTRVPCTFSTIDFTRKSPAYLITRKPIIQVDYDDQVVGFCWNPGIEDVLRVHEDDVEPFYIAYKRLQKITEREELMVEFRLHAGDLLIFNNRRMLHARGPYRSNGGHRRLQVCYINGEDLRSKYVVLGRKLGRSVVISKIGNRSAI